MYFAYEYRKRLQWHLWACPFFFAPQAYGGGHHALQCIRLFHESRYMLPVHYWWSSRNPKSLAFKATHILRWHSYTIFQPLFAHKHIILVTTILFSSALWAKVPLYTATFLSAILKFKMGVVRNGSDFTTLWEHFDPCLHLFMSSISL